MSASGMSAPRQVLPNTRVMSTRRTTRRHFLLKPDADRTSQNIFLYCLAWTAKKCHIEVHLAVVMSTHWHLILTDRKGLLPKFYRDFHRILALNLKNYRGWVGEVVDSSKPSTVDLLTPSALIKKLAYCLANPVACGAVTRPELWPGVTCRVDEWAPRRGQDDHHAPVFDVARRADRPSAYRLESTLQVLRRFDPPSDAESSTPVGHPAHVEARAARYSWRPARPSSSTPRTRTGLSRSS